MELLDYHSFFQGVEMISGTHSCHSAVRSVPSSVQANLEMALPTSVDGDTLASSIRTTVLSDMADEASSASTSEAVGATFGVLSIHCLECSSNGVAVDRPGLS